MRSRSRGAGALVPVALLVGVVLFAMAVPPPPIKSGTHGNGGSIDLEVPPSAFVREGDTLHFRGGGALLGVAMGADGAYAPFGTDVDVIAEADRRGAAHTITTPISLNWRHPLYGASVAQVLRLAHQGSAGEWEDERMFTALFTRHEGLPVVSLLMPHGALFDPDTGLMVVGNAIFHAPEKILRTEARDPRWWKYPGNFHMRGKEWERKGTLQMIGVDGREMFQRHVSVRMNGQMTRGFPQHAFRIGFDGPLRYDLFGEDPLEGYAGFVIRAAGNDQVRAMVRDAFQHALCAGLPFEVSGHRTCVLYINGAYWGVHHLRHRMDEEEIARRYGISKKRITILEDEARFYRGDTAEVMRFEHLAYTTRAWNGHDERWADTLRASMDVDGFLSYMATQMILGNMDWPEQNVKFWRYTGKPKPQRPLDGRWYFAMGDSDLGYGVQAGPEADMFQRVDAAEVPITWLFKGMLRDLGFRERFVSIARALARGPFSAEHSLQELDRCVALMAPEMERHTARWRRPADRATWQDHIEVMRNFAARREAYVLERLDRLERTGE